MNNRFVLTDGQKSVSLLQSNDPSVWSFFSGRTEAEEFELYAKVAATFRALNIYANTIGAMPFTLNSKGGDVYDDSRTWENKVGFLPNPSELFRLNTLSYITTNQIYCLRSSDVLGYKVKNLIHASPYSFKPETDTATGQLSQIIRTLSNGAQEVYKPNDKRLVYMWRLDHTTEVLPSTATMAKAMMTSARALLYADEWIAHFYKRGGIAPTAIALKGQTLPVKKEDEERSWNDWIMGLRKWFGRVTRVYNADSLDVKQFGSGVTDLKNNEVYRQAIENIAMIHGMPLSLLLANSANYATAQAEKSTWFDTEITPFCNWLAYGYNQQVFNPMGLSLQFHPETLDPQQEDETHRAQAFSVYGDTFNKYPTYELWAGMAETLGLEISEALDEAAQAYYTKREEQAEATRQQMESAGVVTMPDGKPLPVQQEKPEEPEDEIEEEEEKEDEKKPVKFAPSLDQMRELQRWQEVAFRKLKRAEPMVFEWRNDTLPDELYQSIKARLAEQTTEDGIKSAFDVTMDVPAVKSEVVILAEAINRLADAKPNH